MGLINEKENYEDLIQFLKNKLENKNEENFSIEDFKLSKKIINDYEKLNEFNNLLKSKNNSKYNLNLVFDNQNIFNQKIERIKKWINMSQDNNFQFINSVKTNKSQNINYNKKFLTKSNDINSYLKKRSSNIPEKKNNNLLSIEKKFYLFQTPNKNEKKSLNENSSSNTLKYETNSNEKIDINNYTDLKIEAGLNNYYKKKKIKFLNRVFKGPPECFRLSSWFIINNIPLHRNKDIYNHYLLIRLNKKTKESIIKDIERTFPNNEDIKNLRSKETNLYHILKAFSNLDNNLGYCQGMNIIVAFLLIITDFNEIDTFYLMIAIFSETFKFRDFYNFSFRGLFSDEFPLLLFLNFIFEFEFKKNIPILKEHFEKLGLTNEIWIEKWLQTLFIILLPIDWCKRIWDCIFIQDIFFLIKFAIAFLKILEKDLLKLDEEIKIFNYFKNIQKYPLSKEKNILLNKYNIENIINNADKIKIDIKYYYDEYLKENEDFHHFINKKSIKYKLTKNEENLLHNSYYEMKETILFPDDDNYKNNVNKKNEYVFINKNNNFDIKSENINKCNENYDEDLDEKVIQITKNYEKKSFIEESIKMHQSNFIFINNVKRRNSKKLENRVKTVIGPVHSIFNNNNNILNENKIQKKNTNVINNNKISSRNSLNSNLLPNSTINLQIIKDNVNKKNKFNKKIHYRYKENEEYIIDNIISDFHI
jgi:hypothetical protein